MNRKGFTLIELTAVIVLIGIITLLVSVPITKIIKNATNDTYEAQKRQIELAAQNWGSDNISRLPIDTTNITVITIDDLIVQDYLEDKVIDPRNKEAFKGCQKIEITYVAGDEMAKHSYKYELKDEC